MCCNVVFVVGDVLYDFIYEDKLLSYETITENGDLMYRYVRSTVLRSHHVLFPLMCGLLMTGFTWLMMYLDSSVPGIQPPTPFSPTRYKSVNNYIISHTYHAQLYNNYTYIYCWLQSTFRTLVPSRLRDSRSEWGDGVHIDAYQRYLSVTGCWWCFVLN